MAITILLIFISSYFHPLLVVVLVFSVLSIIIREKKYDNKKLWILFLGIIVFYTIKILLISNSGYESDQIPGAGIFLNYLPNLFSLPSYTYLKEFVLEEYMLPLLLVISSVLIGIYKKKYLLTFFFLGTILAYSLLTIISYYNGESPYMYQHRYIVYGFFIAIIVETFFKHMLYKHLLILVAIPTLIISLYQIYLYHDIPSKRLAYFENLIKKSK